MPCSEVPRQAAVSWLLTGSLEWEDAVPRFLCLQRPHRRPHSDGHPMAELPNICPVTRTSAHTLQDAEQEDAGDTHSSLLDACACGSCKTVNSDLPPYDRETQAAIMITLGTSQTIPVIFLRNLKGKEHDAHCTDEKNEAQRDKRMGLTSELLRKPLLLILRALWASSSPLQVRLSHKMDTKGQ